MTLLADWQLSGPLLTLWPYRRDVWRANAHPIGTALLQMLERIAPHYPVRLGIHPPLLHTTRSLLPDDLPWLPLRYDDVWIRDSGPCFVARHGVQHAVAGDFDGWQGVHSSYQRDQQLPRQLSRQQQLSLGKLPFIFEGGMLTHDGAGTAIVHARSLRSRNPSWRLSDLERWLCSKLGLTHIIWIHHALQADETGGHVDNQLQFIAPDVIAYAASINDPAWNAEVQELQTQAWASKYRWVKLPDSRTLHEDPELFLAVQRKPGVMARGDYPVLASYVNMIRLANLVVVPQFDYPGSAARNMQALHNLQAALPELTMIPVTATEMIRGGGGPHCLSLVLPS